MLIEIAILRKKKWFVFLRFYGNVLILNSLSKNTLYMKEKFLHYVWRHKRFDLTDLQTTEGESIKLIQSGENNQNAGPDFLNSKIQIGETIWAGNVEIHLKSSDWLAHNHQHNKAYNNVILHVVLEEDRPIFRTSGERIPCLELRNRIPSNLSKIYLRLLNNEHWIPCQYHFFQVSEITKNLWLDRMLVDRLEEKTKAIEQRLEENKGDWEATFYQFLAKNFGLKVNAEPFEMLAQSLPHIILGKHKNNRLQIEALLFGQAGLLEKEFQDDYPKRLRKEYHFLQKKYSLHPLSETSWKFLRMRPANFPTIRLAQFASLIVQSVHLFNKILEIENVAEVEKLFQVQLADYWLTHYVFDKESTKRNKSLGKSAIYLIMINTVVPFLFLFGKRKEEDSFKDKAFRFLEALKPEKNIIVSSWMDLGQEPDSAYQTQALLQLKNRYCDHKKCLDCSIGNSILKRAPEEESTIS